MANELTADDLIPLIKKLSLEERRRLLRLALAKGGDDKQAYSEAPSRDGEFSSDDDLLSWDAEGWEEVE